MAAITIVLYGQFLFNAMYIGFSMGVAPVISYNHGSQNTRLLQRIFRICMGFISISSLVITAGALISAPFIVEIFTPKTTDTYLIAKTAFSCFPSTISLQDEHFFLLHVHSIFRRENFSDHLLCEDICSDCDQYPDPSTDPWSKRSLALGSDRRMYDAFSFPLFYSEKSTPLSLHPKTGLKYRSKIDLPSCCGSCLVCHSNPLDHRLILSFHCSILIF